MTTSTTLMFTNLLETQFLSISGLSQGSLSNMVGTISYSASQGNYLCGPGGSGGTLNALPASQRITVSDPGGYFGFTVDLANHTVTPNFGTVQKNYNCNVSYSYGIINITISYSK